MKNTNKLLLNVLVIIILFFFISYIVQNNFSSIEKYVVGGVYGAILFVFIEIIAMVVAPISALPLLPIVSKTYGWFIAGLLSSIGWTIGSVIAFLLARKYGTPLVKKFVNIEKIHEIEKQIPEENFFWSIVFLRMVLPADILSYVLGLFSKVSFNTYFWATLIGVTPFSFVLAYLGTLPLYYQVIFFTTGLLILVLSYLIYKKRSIT
mgnify:CR=1 FL=1